MIRVPSGKQHTAEFDAAMEVASLQSQVARSAPKLLRGSGSSAVATVMWKLLDQLSAMASNPVWMTYRGVGSGIGENEVVGTAANAYTPAVHFGCSDVPMSKASYQALVAAGVKASVQVIQVPIAVSPMNFFVGIPPSALAANGGVVKLSACTVAKIMTGTIRSWDDPAITADGNAFPARPITYFFRSGNSGTTAVITAYLFAACPTVWTSPSSRSFPAAFAANGNATGSTSSMATESRRGIDDRACDQEAMVRSVRQATGAAGGCCWLQLATKPWSVGYLEVGNGASAPGVTEVSLQNAAGNYLMSSQSDVSAAASQLFQAGGWPTDPTADFSAVTVVNQPGATTWPIASLPFMFVRLDMTTAGDSGALLVALVNYLLRPSTQASMPLLGLQALPLDVLGYTVSRALPLIVPDMRASKWMYELAAAQYLGAGDFVMTDPSLKTTYLLSESIALRSSVATLAGAVLNQTSNINVTALLANYTSNAVPPDLLDRLTAMDNQLSKLQSVAIAGVIFGIAGVALALFAFCRVFVVAATSAVFPGSMATTSSVRRGKSFSTGGDLTDFAKAGPVNKPALCSAVTDASFLRPGLTAAQQQRAGSIRAVVLSPNFWAENELLLSTMRPVVQLQIDLQSDNANNADAYYGQRAVHQWYLQQASSTEAVRLSPISSPADWVASGPLRSLHACLATPTSTPLQPTVLTSPTATTPSQPGAQLGHAPTTPSQPDPVPSVVLSGPPGPLAAALSATVHPQVLGCFLAHLARQQAIVDGGGGGSTTGLVGQQLGGGSTTGLVGQQSSHTFASTVLQMYNKRMQYSASAAQYLAALLDPRYRRQSQHVTREQRKLAEQLLIKLATEDGSKGDRPVAEALSQLALWQQYEPDTVCLHLNVPCAPCFCTVAAQCLATLQSANSSIGRVSAQ
ncbi:hypothetical protein QJQ45_002650 [Haematococcus lacustris]|nr:hypothetical protein QJQ45_002650 [Haematococcus lacustris]